jgi:hypothetical protein
MFGRHFVDVHIKYRKKKGDHAGKVVNQHISGFFLTIRGAWNLVTAGHVLQDLERQLRRDEIEVLLCRLIDTFGANRVTDLPTPFDFEGASKLHVNDDALGLDFGLILLRPLFEASMKANGILPFSEVDWIKQPEEFQRHFMMGLPAILNPALEADSEGRVSWSIRIVHKEDGPPAGVEPTSFARFWGRLEPSERVPDIRGMSGGPIFGLANDKEGRQRYWPVAIQSGWFPQYRIVAGTPLRTMGMLMERYLAEMFDGEDAKK